MNPFPADPDLPPLGPPPPRLLVLVALALVCIGAAGVGLWLLSRQRDPLSLAITSWPAYEYLYLAEQKNLGKIYGLELKVKQSSSLADQRQAFINGDVMAMATTLPEAIAVCQERPQKCPLLVLVLDESMGADRLIALAELRQPAQLGGRRVGLERAVLAEYLLLRSLEGSGLELDDLRLQFDGPVALVERLRGGGLDAIVTYAPHDTVLWGDRRFRVLFSSAAIPSEVVDVLAVDRDFARQQPEQVQALVRTWWQARAWAVRHRREALALIAQRQQITPEQFIRSEQGLRYPGPSQQQRLLAPGGPLDQSLRRMARLMLASGRIRPEAPLPGLSSAYLEVP